MLKVVCRQHHFGHRIVTKLEVMTEGQRLQCSIRSKNSDLFCEALALRLNHFGFIKTSFGFYCHLSCLFTAIGACIRSERSGA